MGKQLMVNARVVMAPERSIAFVAAVPVGKPSELVGGKYPTEYPIEQAFSSTAQGKTGSVNSR